MDFIGTNIAMIRGDDEQIVISLNNIDAEDKYTQDNTDVAFAVKENVSDDDYKIFLKGSLNEAGNEITIDIPHSATEHLFPKRYYYDIQMTHNNKVTTLIPCSFFILKADVVRGK